VVDHDSYEMNKTEERTLSRYAMEQLWIQPDKTKLLLLVKVDDDKESFGGKAAAIDAVQNIERTIISGKQYYRLKCTITDGNRNELVHGIATKQYSVERFESDYKYRRGNFGISFDGTSEKHTFLWNTIMDFPSTYLFFGPPLTQCRAFDSIFKNAKSLSTVHHLFLSYYAEFEGDVEACLALYNAYLHRRAYIFARKVGMLEKSAKNYDKNLFKSKAVVNFLAAIDDCCRESLESVFTEFKDHSRPVVETEVMLDFIAQAPTVFGDSWDKMCEWRGVSNRKADKVKNVAKTHQVFFQLLTMSRVANRERLMNWAFIQSVSNFARGVSKSAETAFAYFGPAVSYTTRHRIMSRLMGS